MSRLLRAIGTTLLFVLVALLLAPTVLPPFLDRVYYRGPASAHFDGQRFLNPDEQRTASVAQPRPSVALMLRFLLRRDRTPWPDHVPLTPGYPAAAGIACPTPAARMAGSGPRCVPKVDPARMFVTWVGHATVLVQVGGINILTDPIWAARAGPWGIFGPRRVRDPGIRFDDLPKIDLVLVSHDHYDHMDFDTLRRLWLRDHPLIVSSLGNDRVMRGAGVESVTRDWGGRVPVRPGIEVIVERVHHWGTRWMSDRNRSLWSGFTVVLPGGNLFFAGDTGAGDMHWPDEAAMHGPVRLAIIPIGAFQPRAMMRGNHIGPIEAVEVYRRLHAAYGLGVHWGTFQLSNEAFGEPPALLARELARRGVPGGRFVTLDPGRNWEIPALPVAPTSAR